MSELEPNADEMGSQLTASSMLVNAREELGLSQKDVADQLFLAKNDIRVIEEDIENFPRKAFIKGYLRSYARVVGISGEEIVACYNEAINKTEKEAESLTIGIEKKVVDQDARLLKPGLFGIAALIVLILLAWLLSDGEDQSVDELVVPVIEDAVIEQTDKDAEQKTQDLIAISNDSSETGVSEEAQQATDSVDMVGDKPSSVTESIPEASVVEEGIVEEVKSEELNLRPTKDVDLERRQDRDVQYIIVRAGGEGVVEFFFEGECWLEIKDGEGDLIYSALNQSGEVLKIFGIPPFDILFGEANAVRVEFNGEKVDLESRVRRDNTARLKLGG